LLLEDGTPYPVEGTLKFSDVTVDPSTGSFILRTVFPNPQHLLLPGMYVRAVVQEGLVDQAILVPQQAVSAIRKEIPSRWLSMARRKLRSGRSRSIVPSATSG